MKKECSECGEIHEVCPECETRSFSKDDMVGEPPIERFVHEAGDGSVRIIKEVCWECEYERLRKLTVEDV